VFNDALLFTSFILQRRRNDVVMSGELERVWKEEVVDYCTVPSQNLLKGCKKK
jgi:hypothetical protein